MIKMKPSLYRKLKLRNTQFKVVNDRLLKHFTQEQLNDLDINIDTFTNDDLKYYCRNESNDMSVLISDLNYSLHERMCTMAGVN